MNLLSYKNCLLCPRRCGIDREVGHLLSYRKLGFCGETSALRLAFAGIHRGEEPPITGAGGSGTIFVTGCNLGCAFCQNYQISQGKHISKGNHISHSMGRVVSPEEFAEICISLQECGTENINIVTGSHAAPAIALGIKTARNQGLSIPVLWNSSGYDSLETLEIVKDFVDVYLPDLKTLNSKIAAKFFNAPDYPDHAATVILKMMEYRKLYFGPGRNTPRVSAYTPAYIVEHTVSETIVQEILVSGVMIRHLVIPGHLEVTRQVLSWFAENCMGKALLSLMTQYTPVQIQNPVTHSAKRSTEAEIPSRYVSENEYEEVLSMLEEFGIDDGYCQELVNDSEWLPDFEQPNPFSSDLSVPVWHWK